MVQGIIQRSEPIFIEFLIPVKPYSINKAYYRRGNKRKELREWEEEVSNILTKKSSSFIRKLKKLRGPPRSIAAQIGFGIPKKHYYTKLGFISKTSLDLTNLEKLLIDIVFKNLGEYTPHLNDAYIESMVTNKHATASSYYIHMALSIFT